MIKERFFIKPLLIFIMLFSAAACSKDSSTEPIIDSPVLEEAFKKAEQISGLKSLVVAKDGNIIKERYWRTGGPNITHDVRSVTKSVTGILIGIAIDKGFINSEDQPIGEFISPLAPGISPEKAGIKIRHLLTMSGGFAGSELASANEYNAWISSSNQVQWIMNKNLVAAPGQRFNYNSAALHLLSVILTRASGLSTRDFAKKYLFDPLGITQYGWEKDKQGYYNGAAGLNITPRDMIKIGQLILNRGEYNGQRIISSAWIDQTIAQQISTNNAQPYGPGYGYCWWIGKNSKGSHAFANGWGGQFIVVVPDLNLVVSASNNWSGVPMNDANNNWYNTIRLIMESIVPEFN